MSTKIDWTDETLTVSTGCTKISAGCKNCYAEKLHKRLNAMGIAKYSNPFNKVTLHPEELKKPFKWKKPRMVFINSMSDLFHEDVPDEFIFEVFAMMNKCQRHTFQVLTKRPGRAVKLKDRLLWTNNIWFGVTVENDANMNRINTLKDHRIGAKIKFISFEPLLSSIMSWSLFNHYIDWIIVGGETGSRARPIEHPEWVESIASEALYNDIPFFFKGWGTATMKKSDPGYYLYRGKEWREMPRR